jgi:hypothetical protein
LLVHANVRPLPRPQSPWAIPPKNSDPVHFGWSQKAPPVSYCLSLAQDDFDKRYDPTPAFIKKISPFLMRENNLQLPGFLMVSNLSQRLPENQIQRFLEKTLVALKNAWSQWHPAVFNPHNIPLTFIKKRQVDGEIPAEGNLHNQETQERWTLKSPHFDRNALMVLHRYEPPENITGGNLQVIDVNQFLLDNPAERIENLLNADKTIRPEYWPALAPYRLTLETNSTDHKVVFLHNDLHNGIAHGVTPFHLIDEHKPMKRVFERYTITKFEPERALPSDVKCFHTADSA